METRFVGEVDDMLKVVGTATLLDSQRGIYMSLPEQIDDPNTSSIDIHRIVYGANKSGKRYIETVSTKEGNLPVYGEASLPEILTFAKKAVRDLPDSEWTKELSELAQKLGEALK